MVKTTRFLVAAALAVAPAACVAVSTFPPTSGSSYSTPDIYPGPELMSGAIKEAARSVGHTGPVVFNLPAGLSSSAWARVGALIGDGAKPMAEGDQGAFSVQQIRLSGAIAEVDVLYPERGVYQLMTVKMVGGGIGPWKVDWAYRWMIPASTPVANAPRNAPATATGSGSTAPSSAPATETELAGEASTAPAAAADPGEN